MIAERSRGIVNAEWGMSDGWLDGPTITSYELRVTNYEKAKGRLAIVEGQTRNRVSGR